VGSGFLERGENMNFLFGMICGGIFGYIAAALLFIAGEKREVEQLRRHINMLKKEIEYWQSKRSGKNG
jgi:gas vesicle protein